MFEVGTIPGFDLISAGMGVGKKQKKKEKRAESIKME